MKIKTSLPTLVLLLGCSLAFAQDVQLRIQHSIHSVGADGITRDSSFSESLIRRDGVVWVQRIIPPGVHEDHDSSEKAGGHKHLDQSTSARWITRAADGKLRVRLVNAHERMTVDIGPADYANIGFDGNWESAWHLLDPRQLKTFKPLPRSAPAGSRWYGLEKGEQWVRVLWDDKLQLPRRVESGNHDGTLHKLMVAEPVAAPKQLPWNALAGYAAKEYSDLLD
ncbi:MAG: hypothetical protein HGA47_12765 [Zoogloea sp.]|nr:hypothetical protein [Zoogloea sp.]